ncbi:hypothetical protein BC939DRAFT_139560 [Gamsiella multidivaricata]|uniref:uncharacterized protein n=1 Tax=Gamsiella multidivaricata TaxID=101098 RepID=UPI002220A487|nr:uncharacterized protein BC939DRAFT_139560 [Gamsiella multidivaricata]KAI7824702.1 hypothetical protein BC939DRAFT_139560 [Gamsiella multidivaricata]
MDDLYDATFYTWLRSEDNVLVTASYLQRLAGEYDLDRIEHALCWLVNGWRLESIAILVKQVTFDWVLTKGDQGELNRARLVLALTDNWAIQYIARLACTLLTSATVSSPPPPSLLKLSPSHSRMPSLPGSPVYSPTVSISTLMLGADGHSYGSNLTMASRPSTPPLSTRPATSSSPSSPSSSMVTSPVFSGYSPQPTHGRRMAISRRLGSPMPMPMASAAAEDTALHLGRHSSATGPLSPAPQRAGHFRQSSSTTPTQHQRHQDHTQQSTPLHYPSFTATPVSAATSVYPSPPQHPTYHPHHCTLSHHNHSPLLQQQQQQQQQQQPHPHRGIVHTSRSHGSNPHVRQQSQPGTMSTSKQHWLQQQSSYSNSPIFYMNKSLFMEELSRKWSFCRLSEFFQCMDPASGISHRFKCKLLKESALKEETSQKQQQSAVASKQTPKAATATQQRQRHEPEQSKQTEGRDTEGNVQVEDRPLSPMDHSPLEVPVNGNLDQTGDVVMIESAGNETQSNVGCSTLSRTSSSSLQSAVIGQEMEDTREAICLHPFDSSAEVMAPTTANSTRTTSVPASTSLNAFQLQQSYQHTDYNDDMNSGLNRGCKGTDGSHQHCRAQTVEAIMSSTLGATGSHLSSSPSLLSSSSAPSPTSTSAASASLSTLTLTESGMEQTSRPMSQPRSQQHQQSLSPFATNFTTQPLYRHATTLSVSPVSSSTISSNSSSTSAATTSGSSTLSIHPNGSQRHTHDSTSTKRKNSLGVGLTPQAHCSSFSSTSSSSAATHSSADASMSSSSAIFPGARRTSTSTSTTNEDLKRLRCSRQNSASSTSGI